MTCEQPQTNNGNATGDDEVTGHAADYFKAIELINEAPVDGKERILKAVHTCFVSKVPNILWKYSSLADLEEKQVDAEELARRSDSNSKRLETLENALVFTSPTQGFNDPFDCRAYFYDSERVLKELGVDLFSGLNIPSYSRIACFTACGENSMPMWAHYASNHRGFCAEYDMRDPENTNLKGLTLPVQYINRRMDLTDVYIEQGRSILAKKAEAEATGNKRAVLHDMTLVYVHVLLCNVKHPSWSYEQEYRCAIGEGAKGSPYVKAKPKAVYIGRSCAKTDEERLISIAKKLSIPAYKMVFNPQDSEYLLSKERIF